MTSAQLELITSDRDWKLDERTVEIGRAGLAKARAALAAATPIIDIPDPANAREAKATEITEQAPSTVMTSGPAEPSTSYIVQSLPVAA